jgi:hypothetical protein
VGGCGLDESSAGLVPVTDSCEHRNKPSGSKKGGEIFD